MMHYVGKKMRTWQILLTAIAAAGLLAACGDPATNGGPEGDVNSITIAGPGQVEEGDTIELTADVDADPGVSTAVEWSSSAPGTAAVNASGVVSGIEEGTVTITATSRANNAVTDTHEVEVVAEGEGTPGGGGDGDGEVDFLVTSPADYDPYSLETQNDPDGRTPDEPIAGTLRQVLNDAPSGSVIGFADDIDEITLFGVDTLQVEGVGHVDAHLILRDDVTIRAEDVTITAVSAYQEGDEGDPITYHSRVLYVPAGVSATLEGLTLQGGGFIVNGGGIANVGTLTLRDTVVRDNHAYSNGGGIFNTGTLTIENSEISENRAVTYEDEEDATIFIRGDFDAGADPEADDLTLSDGGYGGGIYNDGGTVTITGSTISDNEANFSGGGIYDVGANVSVTGSTISGNVASRQISGPESDDEGPDYGGGVFTDGVFTATDTDFSNNESFTLGGGFYLDAAGEADLATVHFESNTADFGGGIFHQFAGDPSNLTPSDPVASSAVTFTANTAITDGANYYASDTTAPPAGELMSQRADAELPRTGDVVFDR